MGWRRGESGGGSGAGKRNSAENGPGNWRRRDQFDGLMGGPDRATEDPGILTTAPPHAEVYINPTPCFYQVLQPPPPLLYPCYPSYPCHTDMATNLYEILGLEKSASPEEGEYRAFPSGNTTTDLKQSGRHTGRKPSQHIQIGYRKPHLRMREMPPMNSSVWSVPSAFASLHRINASPRSTMRMRF